MIKRIGIGLGLLAVGLPVGAGGGYAALQLFPELFGRKAEETAKGAFVSVQPVLVPLVFKDGRLASYVSVECQLEVPADTVEDVQGRLPLFLNAVNMRTYRRPLAAGPDGQLPDLEGVRAVLLEAAREVYGKGFVRKAAISRASPV